jgi:hypothetical protein
MTETSVTETTPTPYVPSKERVRPTAEELRARIPGWGVDLDPKHRPSVPRLQFQADLTGAHWEFPERQPELAPRERSIEHAMLTPVFGTAQPLKGLSGAMRKVAYARYSEARAAHWLILMAADRVDSVESSVSALLRGRPDNPIAETGIKAELSHGGVSSRLGRGRADLRHQPLDPLIVSAGWVLRGGAVALAVQAAKTVKERVAS